MLIYKGPFLLIIFIFKCVTDIFHSMKSISKSISSCNQLTTYVKREKCHFQLLFLWNKVVRKQLKWKCLFNLNFIIYYFNYRSFIVFKISLNPLFTLSVASLTSIMLKSLNSIWKKKYTVRNDMYMLFNLKVKKNLWQIGSTLLCLVNCGIRIDFLIIIYTKSIFMFKYRIGYWYM